MSSIVNSLRAAGCVFAEDEARLLTSAARTPAELAALVERRVAGVPIEHLLGWVEFAGLRIGVDPGVFVPRRRTEFLAHRAVQLLRSLPDGRRPLVVDLCCGSGAVALAVLHASDAHASNYPHADVNPRAAAGQPVDVEVHAVDVDVAAVRCARRNLGARGQVYEGDLFAALPAALRGRVDVLVANAPYVPTDAVRLMPPEARDHEPLVALDGGDDGLDVLRRVVAGAPDWLALDGHVLVETSERQAPTLAEFVTSVGLTAEISTDDDLGATVLIGSRR